MDTQSPRFTLSPQDKQTILSILIHGSIGTVLTLISVVFLHLNYGVGTPVVTTVLSLISLSLTRYVDGPSQSSLLIADLQQKLQELQNDPAKQPPIA